jgi:uncharacterized membrane protein YccC
MATVYIVSSPFVGPTSSKALYRAVGTLGAGGAIFSVPAGAVAVAAEHRRRAVDRHLLFLR